MTTATDELEKPDMQAVLSRTHLPIDIHNFLLPTFESVSNALHGIEAEFDGESKRLGNIVIQFSNQNDPSKFKITVVDNGVGLNDENFRSFKTPFSGYKLKHHGRGFGRFIAFKIFARAIYKSRYRFFSDEKTRSFQFNIAADKEFTYINENPEFYHTGVQVDFDQPLLQWHELIRGLKVDDVADAIASHFLPHFLYKWLPRIYIQFNDANQTNITEHFKSIFVEHDAGNINCDIDGSIETVHYSLTKIHKTKTFRNHCLLFSAADRIVGASRDLTNKLGQPHFIDENNQRYIVLAIVSSTAFEKRLNDSRTGLNLPVKTIERIVSDISDVIQRIEQSQIIKIKSSQTCSLDIALRENPILRIGLRGRSINEYVASKPNNWSAEEFVSDLAIERFRSSVDLTKAITTAANDQDNYYERIQDIVGKLDANKKDALAEYVIHRKSVIELISAARKFGDNGHIPSEDVIHNLVFRRFNDNVSTEYFEHNLWLVDDALAFLPYVSSDRTIHGGNRKKGDKIADIVFFDDSMVLGDNDGTTITIIEFKKPNRDNYSFGNIKSDPVLQVIDTLESAVDKGGISKTDGTYFSFSGIIRRFAFIIADHTPTLIKLLKRHDFKNDWNPKIFFRYRDQEQMLIQAFGYDTLIENAKKRNQAFFSVLLNE